MQKLAAQYQESKEPYDERVHKRICLAHRQLESFLLREECLHDEKAKQTIKENVITANRDNTLEHNVIAKCLEQCIRLFIMHSSCTLKREKEESVNILYNTQNSANLRLLHFIEYVERSHIGSPPLVIVLLISRSLKKCNIFDAITYLEKNITLNLRHMCDVWQLANNHFNNQSDSEYIDEKCNNGNKYNLKFVNVKYSSEQKMISNSASYELEKLKIVIEKHISYCVEANRSCTIVEKNKEELINLYGRDILQHFNSVFLERKSLFVREQKSKTVTVASKNCNTKKESENKNEEKKSVITTHILSSPIKFDIANLLPTFVLTKWLPSAYTFFYIKSKKRQILRIVAYIIAVIVAQFVLRKSVKLLSLWRSVFIKSPTLSLAKARSRQLSL